MRLLPNELARIESNRLILRPEPVRLGLIFDDLPAADGHALRVRFSFGVRALEDPAETQMLRDVLMGSRPALTMEDVTRHFAPTLRSAAVGVADDKGVEAWLSGEDKELFSAPMATAAQKIAFACGLEILPPYDITLESPSYEQKRLRDLQRSLAEQEAAGRVEHFSRATQLLQKFEEIREKSPELTPGAILGQLSPIDQGATLQTLLLAAAKRQQANDLWAVGGEYLVRIDARSGAPKTQLFPLPPTLGPLRSVQSAMIDSQRVLLVGARSGFYLVRLDDPEHPEIYPDHGIESPLGFSRVVFQNRDRGFAACHGEAGLVRWTYAHTNAPSEVLRPERFGVPAAEVAAMATAAAGSIPPPLPGNSYQGSIAVPAKSPAGPRNLQVLDDRRLLMSVGSRLLLLDGSETSEIAGASSSDIAAIIPDGRLIHAVHEDGTIATLDASSLQTVATRRRPMRVRTAGALPLLGSTRLLLAGDEGPVQCVGVDDSLVTEYVSNHRGLRGVAGSADLIAGISADRQRVVLWNTWEGRAPLAEVYITAQIRHRIADVEFA